MMIPENIEENLHYIELFTRKRIRNPLVGNHISMLKGHGYDFWDHKQYQRGDDTRKIDWNATARMGVTLVKNTHEEKDVDIFVVADMSDSMGFVTGEFSKREVLLYITAALTFSALADNMRVGFIGFADRVELEIEPRKDRGHLWAILNRVWDFKPRPHRSTRIVPALESIRQRLKKMSILFLVSDFLYRENMFETMVFQHVASHHDLIPIVLSDAYEANLPRGRGYLRLQDLETGRSQCVRLSDRNRLAYAEYLRKKERGLRQQFYRFGLDFQSVQTDQPFYELVLSLFLMRKRS